MRAKTDPFELISTPVPPWCLECRDFRYLVENAKNYGCTPNAIAILALRACQSEPTEITPEEGEALEYFQTQMPNCPPGKMRLDIDYARGRERLRHITDPSGNLGVSDPGADNV